MGRAAAVVDQAAAVVGPATAVVTDTVELLTYTARAVHESGLWMPSFKTQGDIRELDSEKYGRVCLSTTAFGSEAISLFIEMGVA